jgi:hypothetical protein
MISNYETSYVAMPLRHWHINNENIYQKEQHRTSNIKHQNAMLEHKVKQLVVQSGACHCSNE